MICHIRIDRLGSILINDFFPYYKHWPFNEPRWSKAFTELTREGHDIWASNWVHEAAGQTYKVLSLKNVNPSPCWVIPLTYNNRNNAVAVSLENLKSYTATLQPPNCTCTKFTMTGKYCKHLWAAQWHKSNGSIDDYLYAQKQGGDCG